MQFFRQHGYFQAEVHSELVPQNDHGLVNVLFHTDLGMRAKFGKINLTGATPEETAYLAEEAALGDGAAAHRLAQDGDDYSYDRLQGATKYMQSQLAKQNYVAGQVKLVSAEYDANTNRADITFDMTTGPTVKVATTGAHLWGRTFAIWSRCTRSTRSTTS